MLCGASAKTLSGEGAVPCARGDLSTAVFVAGCPALGASCLQPPGLGGGGKVSLVYIDSRNKLKAGKKSVRWFSWSW